MNMKNNEKLSIIWQDPCICQKKKKNIHMVSLSCPLDLSLKPI